MSQAPSQRYTGVAIFLHWAIAISIILLFPIGLFMSKTGDAVRAGESDFSPDLLFTLFQMHKTFGILVLALSLARVVWRLMNPPPPLPEGTNTFERLASSAVHGLFYVLIIAIPLSGWVMISASPLAIDTYLFMQPALPWPHLPMLADLTRETQVALEPVLKETHELLAYGAAGLLALHVAAALKHQFVNRDRLLTRMGVAGRAAPPEPARGLGAVAGVLALVLGGGLTWGWLAESASARQADEGTLVVSAPSEDSLTAPTPSSDEVASVPSAEERDDNAPLASESPPATDTDASASTEDGATETVLASNDETPAAPSRSLASEDAGSAIWTVDHSASAIEFTLGWQGSQTVGTFGEWTADIVFDPDNLAASSASVTINGGSGVTGDAYLDGQMDEADGFDTAQFGAATYVTSAIRSAAGGGYEAHGVLTIRGVSQSLVLPFTVEIENGRARMHGALDLNRLDFGLGAGSDPSGGFLSTNVGVSITVEADRAP